MDSNGQHDKDCLELRQCPLLDKTFLANVDSVQEFLTQERGCDNAELQENIANAMDIVLAMNFDFNQPDSCHVGDVMSLLYTATSGHTIYSPSSLCDTFMSTLSRQIELALKYDSISAYSLSAFRDNMIQVAIILLNMSTSGFVFSMSEIMADGALVMLEETHLSRACPSSSNPEVHYDMISTFLHIVQDILILYQEVQRNATSTASPVILSNSEFLVRLLYAMEPNEVFVYGQQNQIWKSQTEIPVYLTVPRFYHSMFRMFTGLLLWNPYVNELCHHELYRFAVDGTQYFAPFLAISLQVLNHIDWLVARAKVHDMSNHSQISVGDQLTLFQLCDIRSLKILCRLCVDSCMRRNGLFTESHCQSLPLPTSLQRPTNTCVHV